MRLTRSYVAHLLVGLGVIRADSLDSDIRKDAGESAAFLRGLEFIQSEVYRIVYPDLRALDFIPLDSSVPAGADSFTIRIWDWFGSARIIANYADDLPTVGLLAAEKSQLIKSLGVGYDYSIQDVRGAAFSGVSLDTEKAGAARRAHENKIEQIAAFGDTGSGLPGFVNHVNCPIIAAPGPIAGDWANPATTSQSILDDLHYIANTTAQNTRKIVPPDTMILPAVRYDVVATKRMSQYDSTPVLRAFLEASPYIRNVDQWPLLDTADSMGSGPRGLCYRRDRRVVKIVVPQPFEQLPPQQKGLAFFVPCHSRFGGVVMGHPLGVSYFEGI